MRLKSEDMIQITADELDALKSALRMSREAIGEACGISKFAPGRWRQSEAMPKKHLLTLARILAHRSQGPLELAANQKLAIKLVEEKLRTPIALLAAEGSATINAASPIFPEKFPKEGAYYVPQQLTDQATQVIQTVPLEQLINEIGRRGFKIQLEPKE